MIFKTRQEEKEGSRAREGGAGRGGVCKQHLAHFE